MSLPSSNPGGFPLVPPRGQDSWNDIPQFILAWVVWQIVSALVSFGLVMGGLALTSLLPEETRSTVETVGVTWGCGLAGLAVSFLVFRWSVKKFLLSRV